MVLEKKTWMGAIKKANGFQDAWAADRGVITTRGFQPAIGKYGLFRKL
jgi:hypothetical protein